MVWLGTIDGDHLILKRHADIHILRQMNAIGIASHMLQNRNLKFKYITLLLKRARSVEVYHVSRSTWSSLGVERTFGGESQIFVPLSLLEQFRENSPQLTLGRWVTCESRLD